MEYKQITLTEWLDIKKKLKEGISSARDKINGLKKDFVKIGYLLRKIDDNELYKQDGYKSIAEFAKAECGLSPSDTTRFIQINKKYSIGGNSEELRPEFIEYGQSKLAAMLSLPDADLNMITPQTSREDIRELNRFNKSVPEQGADGDIEQLINDFYISQELVRKAVAVKGKVKELQELIAPSGSRSFRKGIWFIMFHENKINIKKYSGVAKEISWEEFAEITAKVLEKYELEHIAKKQEETEDTEKIAKTINKTASEVERMMNEIVLGMEEMSERQKRTRTYRSLSRVKQNMKPITISLNPSQKRTWDTQRNQRERRNRKRK